MTFKKTLVYVGLFLKINSLILLAPALIAVYYSENAIPFVISSVFSYLVGILLTRESHTDISYADAMLISSLTLLMVSMVGAVPYFTIVEGSLSTRVVDVFFESVSGYTTTGLSIILDVS